MGSSKNFFVLILSILACDASFAKDCLDQVPKSPDWIFASVLIKSEQATNDRLLAINNACEELDKNETKGQYYQTYQGLKAKGYKVVWATKSTPIKATTAFSNLKDSKEQKQYMEEIGKIKKNPDPTKRIQDVYMLAIKYQGQYAKKPNGAPASDHLLKTPSKVIEDAKNTGFGGVCRDFSNLLYWSLLQVARPAKAPNNMSALDENSFSMEHAYGSSGESAHAWIRINLPRRDARGIMQFDQFDLDTTAYTSLRKTKRPFPDSSLAARARRALLNEGFPGKPYVA